MVGVHAGRGTATSCYSILRTVSRCTPSHSATYSYLANSPLVNQTTFKQDTAVRMTTSKQFDYLNRLTSISSVAGSATMGNSYAYNNANQRIRSTVADGSYWLFEYDSLGQVRSGRKYWPDQTPVAGQQFEYAHDDIGNRTSTKAGGDSAGQGLRPASYSANVRNQYESRDVPGAVDVTGVSFATNAVTVNGQTAYRKGEYFRAEVAVNNSSVPVWEQITVGATGQSSATGNEFVPKSQELFYYDADGNLTNDGRWTYTWDSENRLVKLTPNTGVGPQVSLRFEYDWQGRRIHKQVWSNTNWNGYATNDVKFLYDGWNLIAELNGTNSALIRSFAWGTDLSGSMQGAGGVGGLLFIHDLASGMGYCAPAFDGNGNVIGLFSMAGATNCATFEFGPFGEVVRATGPMAKANPFRFSTKYQDDETDLLYYGYRYYNACTGRWPNRDPIGEYGFQVTHTALIENMVAQTVEGTALESPNAYLFVRNNPTEAVDLLGLAEVETGVNRAETPFAYIAIESHYFLEVEGNTCGFWPRGGKKKLLSLLPFMWVKGEVRSPDDMAPPEKLTPVKLDDCKYDIKKFKSCVQAQCNPHDTGRYNLLFYNCWHWRESLIEKCKKASKR